jgi:sugar lactone lactonase YvrE
LRRRGLISFIIVGLLGCLQAFGQCTITTPVAAAGASIGTPGALALDAAGKLYFTSGNCILGLDLQSGMLTRVAGGTASGYSGDGGPASSATFSAPGGLATDDAGNLFIADSGNHAVRVVMPDGNVATIAGGGVAGYSGNGGPATMALLNGPQGVAADHFGNLFIADTNNNVVRLVSPSGIITTYAGDGMAGYDYDGFFAREALLDAPIGLAVSSGNLYIGDSANNRIRMVTAARLITTLAGNGVAGYLDDDDAGQDGIAELNTPTFVASDRLGLNIFISDSGNNCIRQVLPDTVVATAAGGTKGAMGTPAGIALDEAGNLYIADTTNSRILKLAAGFGITTVAGK